MSRLRRMLCSFGKHDWRGEICFYCGKKKRQGGEAGARPTGRATPAASLPAPAAAAADTGKWRVGEIVLDLYEVKEIFESGGMGLVYRVHHRGWNVDLAVKSPRAEHFRTEEQRQQFEREIDAWIGLGLHPHIASCYYVRTLGGVPRVFAEFVPGGPLHDWIADRRLYAGGREAAQERLLDVALQIAWAMGYAHTQGAGLVHQDLKPLNVLMTPEGTAKVTDFGLAQARGRAGAAESATDGRTVYVAGCGLLTPAYASPEQYAQGQGVALSRKSDLWSWAVVMLELYLGGLPWDPRISGHLALAHGLEGYLKSGVQDPQIPPMPTAFQGLLRDCLKPNPAERPADFAAVAERLAGIYREAVGRDYPRVPPAPAALQADALSNRAISMLELGREREAQALFEQALAQEPGHPQATYNWGLVRWRRGEISDLDLAQQLEQARDNRPGYWMAPYLLGLVHLERRDAEGAQAALTKAQGLVDCPEIRAALSLVPKIPASAGRCIATLEGHTGAVTAVAVSADGRRALSGSGDTTLRLWDLDRGKCLVTLGGHTDKVWSVALSPDGRRALSGSHDMTLRLWDLDSGRCIRTLNGHTDKVWSVALSAGGHRALSGSSDGTVRLWDLDCGKCLVTLEGHTDEVWSIALSPDGRRALSGSRDMTLRLWDLDSGHCLRTFCGHTPPVHSVVFSVDGRLALSGSTDNTPRLWDLDSGHCLRTLCGHTNWVSSVVFSVDGRRALTGSMDKTLRLWDLDSGRCLRTLEGHTDNVTSLALWAKSRRILSGSWDKTLRVWDTPIGLADVSALRAPMVLARIADAAAVLSVEQQYRNLLTRVDLALAAGRWAEAWNFADEARNLPGYHLDPSALEREHLSGWRGGMRQGLRNGWCQKSLGGQNSTVTSVAISADSRRGLSGTVLGTMRLWDMPSGKCLRTLDGPNFELTRWTLNSDGRRALSGGLLDMAVRLWDLDTGKCLRTLEGHTDKVLSVALSPDGRWGLSGSADMTLRLWELDSGKCVRVFRETFGRVSSATFTADGHRALSCGGDRTVSVWDLISGRCLQRLELHVTPIFSPQVSADGLRLLFGNGETLYLWDLESAQCLRSLKGHTDGIRDVALSADGRWAMSASLDNTLRLWDLDSGECTKVLTGHAGCVISVALSTDGRWALSGGVDETVRLWELEWDYAFPEPRNWDEGARPYLRNFLAQHSPRAAPGTSANHAPPTWDEAAREQLQRSLCDAGYGWLRPEGVRRELQQMVEQWPLLAESFAREQPPVTGREPSTSQIADGADRKVGRNEPCPCGSGKKYKHCHGRAA